MRFSARSLLGYIVALQLILRIGTGHTHADEPPAPTEVTAEAESSEKPRAADTNSAEPAAATRQTDAERLIAAGANGTLATEIASYLGQQTVAHGPGVAVLVARDGELVFQGATGLASIEHDVPITLATKFRIGSITKQFTAAAILKLQEEGRLKLTDTLSTFLPDFPRGADVTIHHLLTHTSGIASFTDQPDFLATAASGTTPEAMIEQIAKRPFDFEPGQKFHYNNSGYFLLGVIISKISGQSYGDYLRSTFFEPLEMRNTGVHTATAILPHEATGYSVADKEVSKAIDWDMSRAGGAGNLYSTVEDLYRWNEALFGGKVLGEETLKLAFTPVDVAESDGPKMPYGYGWVIDSYRGARRIGHGGGLHGFMSHLIRYPDQQTTVVVLHNGLPPSPGLIPTLLSDLLTDVYLAKELQPREEHIAVTNITPEELDLYVGRYDYGTAVLEVTREENRLFAQLTGQEKIEIFPEGNDKFFWKVVDAHVQFQRENNAITGARHFQNGVDFLAARMADVAVVDVDEETLERYVGKYDYPGLGIMTIRREGKQLKAQMVGQPEFDVYASAKDTFFWKVVRAEARFVVDESGNVTGLVHQQSGATIAAQKVK